METTPETMPAHQPADGELPDGQQVGEYVIRGRLGKGGFGTVYRAVHPVIGAQVAIKVLARRFSGDEEVVSRFIAEARAVNQIRHHNIIDIFAFSQLPDGRHYYVMELLDGETLDKTIESRGAMSLDEALPILRGVARALDAAHAKGIAHRDLKPENILLAHDADGRPFPKLLDFGIAKLLGAELDGTQQHKTATGSPIGTPFYMSPEQCRGRDVDHRTDIYSFGILAYRVLTARYPFEADDTVELLYKQMHHEPPPPSSIVDLPEAVDTAIAWMMRKDASQRPATVIEGLQAIDPAASSTPSIPPNARTVRATDPALAETVLPMPPTSRRRLVGIGLAAAVVIGIGVTIAITQRGSSKQPVTDRPIVQTPMPSVADAPAPQLDATAERRHVVLTFTGAPKGTVVSIDNKERGPAPGPFEVERGGTVSVRLVAPGHEPLAFTTTASEDRAHPVTLKQLPPKPPRPRPRDTRDDTVDPDKVDFGQGKAR